MINIITGRPGTGKTYVLVSKALEYMGKGIDVYSNIPIKTESTFYHYFTEFSELINVKNGIIILDEAQIYMNSRQWEALPSIIQYKLQQHRKHGLHIWGTVQNLSRLDVVMRELVGRYYEVHKIGSSEKEDGTLPKRIWGIIMMTEFLPEQARIKNRKLMGMKFFLLRRSVCEMYDTLKDIGFAENPDIVNVKMFVCPTCQHKKILYTKNV